LWLKNLFSKKFFMGMLQEVKNVELGEKKRLMRLLNTISAEIDAPPTYYVIDKVSDKFGLPTPPKKKALRTLINLGYQASPTHFNYKGIKTNAPAKLVKSVVEQTSSASSSPSGAREINRASDVIDNIERLFEAKFSKSG
jgi:tRNA (guanine26-N2/guanine27-N2)-dimethyltransferase